MTVLYLTNNLQLAGTARILCAWLQLGRSRDVDGCVAVRARGELATWLDDQGVAWRTSPMDWPAKPWPVPGLVQAWQLARWARRQGATLVHCNEHDVYPFGAWVARLMGVPIVCHVRFAVERGFCQWAFGGWRQPDALLWTTNQQRNDCADAIAGLVPEDRQHLVRLGPDPDLFHPPQDRPRLRAQLDLGDDDIVIGTATALRPIKRIDDFVALIRDLAARHPNVVGLIAGGVVPGDEPYAESIQRHIQEAGLGRRLRWIGHREPIADFLGALDLFVSTSEYETFGNSVCEAMSCGLPVAAYVGGSVHEIVGEAGIVVDNGDLPALTAAADRLVRNAHDRVEYGQAGCQRVREHFSPRTSHARLKQVYASVSPSSPALRGSKM